MMKLPANGPVFHDDPQLLADEAEYSSFGDTVHYVDPPKIFRVNWFRRGADGRFLYVSNRGQNAIARFAIAKATDYALSRKVWKEPIGAHQGVSHPLAEAYVRETAAMQAVMATDDAREGPRAFMEKRPPRWSGT